MINVGILIKNGDNKVNTFIVRDGDNLSFLPQMPVAMKEAKTLDSLQTLPASKH